MLEIHIVANFLCHFASMYRFFSSIDVVQKKSKWCTFCCLGNGGLTLEGIPISIMTVHQSSPLIGLPIESFPEKNCQNFQETFNQR